MGVHPARWLHVLPVSMILAHAMPRDPGAEGYGWCLAGSHRMVSLRSGVEV